MTKKKVSEFVCDPKTCKHYAPMAMCITGTPGQGDVRIRKDEFCPMEKP